MKDLVVFKKKESILVTSVLLTAIALSPSVSIANTVTEAVTGGKAKVDFRLRAELVDQEGISDSANATSLRTRIGYETGSYMGLTGFFEFENTTALIDDYAYPGVNEGKFPVVADPEGTEVNQAFLSYTNKGMINANLGRQRIIFDGARFVGNVGWRQNEQTYDGVLLSTPAIPKSTLKYAYLTKINNIFGDEVEFKSHLANYSFSGIKGVNLGAYAYLLDFDTGSDSKTMGINAKGKYSATSDLIILYSVEFAQMSDYAENNSYADASYYALEAGAKFSGFVAKLGYEVLGGDGTTSFQTPLATKHKFNGWADKFLTTPADGLTDTYLTVSKKVMGIKLSGTYHMFSSDNDSKSYGSELDLLAVKKFGKHYTAGIKYANYMADEFSVDTSKVWLWGGVSF